MQKRNSLDAHPNNHEVELVLQKQFDDHIDQLFPQAPSSIAIAVSGGADSMALALLAHNVARRRNISVVMLTVDHGLRIEAKNEVSQIKQWFLEHGISHVTLAWEGQKPVANIQHQARQIRYQLLLSYCKRMNIKQLWFAHHLQDQAETVISRLMRGSGIDGLSAMEPVSMQENIVCVRPLLSFTKEVLIDYLKALKQPWIEDPSNKNIKFERVRVRQWLEIVEDKALFIKRLSQTAIHMARAKDFIGQEVAKALEHVLVIHPAGYIILDQTAFQGLHVEIGLRVLNAIIVLLNHEVYKGRFEGIESLYHALIKDDFLGATLSRCQFSKGLMQKQLLIMRERVALQPPIKLTKGKKVLWDQRFICTWHGEEDAVTVGAADEEVVRYLKEVKWSWDKNNIPLEVFYTLPVFRAIENIVAIPHIGYYASTCSASGCSSEFKAYTEDTRRLQWL